VVSSALRNISTFSVLIGTGSQRCCIKYRRIEEEDTSESHRIGKDGLTLKTSYRARHNRSPRDRRRAAVADEFESDDESDDESSGKHFEDDDDDEDEDDLMGYARIRLACKPSIKWNVTDCHSSLEISGDGLGLHAIGRENIQDFPLGRSARATIPFFCESIKPTFAYFEIDVIDGGYEK
jgi:hypothetical protein